MYNLILSIRLCKKLKNIFALFLIPFLILFAIYEKTQYIEEKCHFLQKVLKKVLAFYSLIFWGGGKPYK